MMQFLYNIVVGLVDLFLPVLSWFSPKMKLAYKGRKATFSKLSELISVEDDVIWMHCASLGEFEQGRSILEQLRKQYPNKKLLLSFFSPSGYEIRKDYKQVDAVVYLPIDTPKKVKRFLELAHPSLVIFVKYEIWPNLLKQIQHNKIKTILVSGIFREEQHFFTKKNTWFRAPLDTFSHFFVQDQKSVALLQQIGFTNVTLAGDTRFDRVKSLVSERREIEFINEFCADSSILVAGSTWKPDEDLLVAYINNTATENEKFIIAPHNIKPDEIKGLVERLTVKTVLYSQANEQNIAAAKVLIIDSIGKLTSLYGHAHIAYVGGGFGSGIHNILEPATYGIPILIGPKYNKFKEALDLVEKEACVVVHSVSELETTLQSLIKSKDLIEKKGKIASEYVEEHVGATNRIMTYIHAL